MKFKGLILVCCVFLLMVCFSGCKKSSEAGTTEETTIEESTAEETMTETTDTTAKEAPAEESTEAAPVE